MNENKPTKHKEVFNPIKEDKDGIQAKRMIWSSIVLDAAIKGLTEGKKLLANPFYENNIKLLKGDLVYQRTEYEIEEWKKCKNDILYFAEKYCQLMTPEGIKHVHLRDYQKNYLTHLTKHQLSIYLACRQCGKCVIFNELAICKGGIPNHLYHYFNEDLGYYEIPLFELYNLYDDSANWKIKYKIYKYIHNHPKSHINEYLYKIISNLDKSNRSEKKIIKSYMMDNIQILTPGGWVDAMYIHQTRPFEQYNIEFEDGTSITCADDHILYSENYPIFAKDIVNGNKIDIIDGSKIVRRVTINYDRVSMCDISVNSSDHNYYVSGCKSHNTTTSAIYLLHYICFNTDKTALCTGNKRRTAIEILDKIKKVFFELPYFLKPGVYKWNEAELAFDNGCRILAEATTLNTGIGFSINLLLLDEFAHLPENISEKFYNNIFPTVVSSKSQMMITSTQNGYNLFYRLWSAAEAGENDYAPFKTDYYEVPEWNPEKKCWEKRDEAWRQRQVANYGSEEAFNSQFGTNFDVSANTLIAQKVLNKRKQRLVNFVSKDLYGVSLSENFIWHPNYEPMEQLRKDHIIITVDLAEGTGNDYITYAINRLKEPGSGKIECIGMFRANNIRREDCTLALQLLCCYYCDFNKLLISFEKNTYGEIFLRQIYDGIENHPIISQKFDPGVLAKYYTNEKKTNFSTGIKVTPGNKTAYCLMFKESYEKDLIQNDSGLYMTELDKFCDDGTGHFKASFGHDDMVMAMIQLEFVKATLQYKFLKELFDSQISKEDEIYYNPYGEVEGNFDQANWFEVEEDTMNSLEKRLRGL